MKYRQYEKENFKEQEPTDKLKRFHRLADEVQCLEEKFIEKYPGNIEEGEQWEYAEKKCQFFEEGQTIEGDHTDKAEYALKRTKKYLEIALDTDNFYTGGW